MGPAAVFLRNFLGRTGFGKRGGLHDKNEVAGVYGSRGDPALDVFAGGANGSISGFTAIDDSNPACPPIALLAASRRLAVRHTETPTNRREHTQPGGIGLCRLCSYAPTEARKNSPTAPGSTAAGAEPDQSAARTNPQVMPRKTRRRATYGWRPRRRRRTLR